MIIYDRLRPRIEAEGTHIAIIPYEFPATRRTTIRVGTRSFQLPGPAGDASLWERAQRQGQYYQEIRAYIVPHAIIRVHNDIDIHCYNGTREQFRMLDNTFPMVPPDHLRRVVAEKTEGFRLVSVAGRGASGSLMGGLNPDNDFPSTDYDDRRAILITYGALWENHRLGICPTVFHEIGHVMTHGRNGLGIASVDSERDQQLRGVSVSRNEGQLEALCNAYMYFICYGSTDPEIRRYGSLPASIQKDQRTRNALRRCPAFRRLDDEWTQRFAER